MSLHRKNLLAGKFAPLSTRDAVGIGSQLSVNNFRLLGRHANSVNQNQLTLQNSRGYVVDRVLCWQRRSQVDQWLGVRVEVAVYRFDKNA